MVSSPLLCVKLLQCLEVLFLSGTCYVYKSPFTACEDDEKFVASVKARAHQLIGGDLHLLHLLHLLALFSPIDNDHLLEARELVDLLKHFQQKISIMIYTNLLSR